MLSTTLAGARLRKVSSANWRSELAMFLSSCSRSFSMRLRCAFFLRFGNLQHQVELGGGAHRRRIWARLRP